MRGLLSRHPFGCWLTAATLSTLGESVSGFAIGWVAAGRGAGSASLVLTAESIPLAVLVLVGGVVADRYGVRRVMLACDLMMALVMGTLALGWTDATPLWALVVVGVLAGGAAALRRPAGGVFPRLFGAEGLDRRLATVASLSQVARIAGPAAGGVLAGAVGLPGTAALDAASFLLIAVVLVRVRPPYEELGVGVADDVNPWRRVVAAARTAASTPGVPPTLLTIVGLAATVLPLVMVVVPLAGHERGWGAGTTGLVSSGWVGGGLLVTLAVARWGAAPPGLSAAGPLLGGAGVLLLAASRGPLPAVAAAVLVGVGGSLLTTSLVPSFVARTPPDMLARFQSLLQVAQTGPVLVATPALGLVCAGLGVRAGLVTVALLLLVTSLPARRAVSVTPAVVVTG